MGRQSAQRPVVLLSVTASLALGIALDALGADRVSRSRGQTLYVAAYSHVLLGEGDNEFPVTSTLVVRNTDPTHPITIVSVEYRDSKGGHLRQFVPVPIPVAGYASREFVVKESDVAGGHSPSFLVR